MNLFGTFTIDTSNPQVLRIHRHEGLLFWLFILAYCGIAVGINGLFFAILREAHLPRTLTCRQQQTIQCEYVIPGRFTGKRLDIPAVKAAIVSPQETGDTIVLTSSQPWVNLGATANPAGDVQAINAGLAQLNQGEAIWQLEMYEAKAVQTFIRSVLIPVGLGVLSVGLVVLFRRGAIILELDAAANRVSLIRFGAVRSQLSLFSQLTEANSQVAGHLGVLSEKFGIYGGDARDRRRRYRVVRLVFTHRRPFIIHQQRNPFDSGQDVIAAVNTFIAEHRSNTNLM